MMKKFFQDLFWPIYDDKYIMEHIDLDEQYNDLKMYCLETQNDLNDLQVKYDVLKIEHKAVVKERDELIQQKHNPYNDLLNNAYKRIVLKYTKRKTHYSNVNVEIDVRDFLTNNWTVRNPKTESQVFNTHITYVWDNYQQQGMPDYWQFPVETKALSKGDCLSWNTKLLKHDLSTINIEDVELGDFIIGKNSEPVKVLNKWDKGVLPTIKIILNNGSEIVCTKDHKFLLNDESEVLAKDLSIGDELLQFDHLELPSIEKKVNHDFWKLIGLFVADGWIDYEHHAICISGKDGYPKEEQKLWVKKYCEERKLRYYWHERYICFWDDFNFPKFAECGGHAINKKLYKIPVMKNYVLQVLEGLKADSYTNKNGSITFGTISTELKNQLRILYRILGISVYERQFIPTKTQYGNNPIWRIYPRIKQEKALKVVGIVDNGEEHVYDIEVQNHQIYLPENDCLVHNCEDSSVLKVAMIKQSVKLDLDTKNRYYIALGLWNGEGHAFPVRIDKDLNFEVVEATSNNFNPTLLSEEYQIYYLFNETGSWQVDGSLVFGKRVLKDFEVKVK